MSSFVSEICSWALQVHPKLFISMDSAGGQPAHRKLAFCWPLSSPAVRFFRTALAGYLGLLASFHTGIPNWVRSL
eukprot:352917-Chlamydomonas_euryale.AAC.12